MRQTRTYRLPGQRNSGFFTGGDVDLYLNGGTAVGGFDEHGGNVRSNTTANRIHGNGLRVG